MTKGTLGLAVLCGWLMASGAVRAHHSVSGVYDIRKTGEVTGVISKIFLTNPHGLLWLDVKNKDGSMTKWTLSTASAPTLARLGIFSKSGPNHIEVGDRITATYYPTRNSKHLGFLKTIKMPNGHVIVVARGTRP